MNKLLRYIYTLTMLVAAAMPAWAFPTDTYTTTSRLSQGRWVKVAVPQDGVYLLTPRTLSNWGFSNPERVRVYGYGGRRLSDVLSLENYIDDLPEVPVEMTAQGIVFYGAGPVAWRNSGKGWTHTVNPFSTEGYYYITEVDEGVTSVEIAECGHGGAMNPAKTFSAYALHEQDSYKLGETGHQLLGEDFKWTTQRAFNFDLTDIVTTEPVTMACQFVARTLSQSSSLQFWANGKQLPQTASDIISPSANSHHSHGMQTVSTKSFDVAGPQLEIRIKYTSPVTVSAAHLDFIEIAYTRHLRMNKGRLDFRLSGTEGCLEGATASTRIWDVTNPLDIKRMKASTASGSAVWTNDYTGTREYVAWDESAALPAPEYRGEVANQNLHDASVLPDMVIVAIPEFQAQAKRIADLHAADADSLLTIIVNPQEIYHEFGSGCADVVSIRRYFKMLYDRGEAAGHPLKYALLIGKPTFDNRGISDKSKALYYPVLPTWQSDNSLDDNSSFTTDDIFGHLRDNSGLNPGADELCIAVGRIPARTVADLRVAVDKIYHYVEKSSRTSWRNQVLLLADDENSGVHMEQSEDTWRSMMEGSEGMRFNYTKVYTDAFEAQNGTYPAARERMYNRLDQGLLWWNFIGHANPTSWTAEGMLTYKDINNLFVRDYPVLYAATCEFLNWDSNSMSGAEIMYFTRDGGIIAAITAVRPVYISDNGALGKAFAKKIFNLGPDDRFLPLGEIYRQGKNNLLDNNGNIMNNPNKLRYVFMGDPALRMATPANRVELQLIDGEEVDPEAQITLMGRQILTLEGQVTDPRGRRLDTFDGDITIDIYDAEYSTTSNGYGEGKRVVFDEQGVRLYTGRDSVNGGRFKMRVAMPEAVANNFRPAAMSLYATSHDGRDAVGMNRDFYVYGLDTEHRPDTVPPAIITMYLNHPTFRNGDKVNPTPMLLARVEDNIGFNLSALGVGHCMTLQVDGNRMYSNVAEYFTPDMGSLSGTIAFPIDELTEGVHDMRLRVWDTNGNHAEQTLQCFVVDGLTPEIYEVYADTNPASVDTRFYVSHNRPDAILNVTVEVFNLLGQPVWSDSIQARSDSNTSAPLTWHLTDAAGRRVQRGIYLYRATITEKDGTKHATGTNRIAVTGH